MMMRWRLDRPDGSHCLLVLERAETFLSRFLGLLGRAPLPDRHGLWLLPCSSVHSLGMRAAIDVLFIDDGDEVIAVRAELAPMRVAADPRARSVIELRGGEAVRLRIGPGARLRPFDAVQILAGPTARRFVSIPSQESIMNQTPIPTTRRRSVRPARAAAAAAAVAAASLASGCASPPDLPESSVDAAPVLQLETKVANDDPAAFESSPAAIATATPAPTGLPVPAATAEGSAVGSADRALEPAGEPGAHEVVEPGLAEQFYRTARFDEALSAFRAIVAQHPDNAHAWLRIGNVLHRKRDWFDALSAYRKAARPQAEASIREKAVYNIALLNLELARQAMKRLERMRSQSDVGSEATGPRGAGVSDGALKQLSDQVASGYRDLSATVRRPPDALATTSRLRSSQGDALPAEQPVEVEIRQGGGGK